MTWRVRGVEYHNRKCIEPIHSDIAARYFYREGRAQIFAGTFHFDLAFVTADNVLSYRKPEAKTTVGTRARPVCLCVLLEDMRQERSLDARARVDDLHHHVIAISINIRVDPSARRRKFNGVRQ